MGEALKRVSIFLVLFVESCYTDDASFYWVIWRGEEVAVMEQAVSFILSVIAGIVANFASKWLSRHIKKR